MSLSGIYLTTLASCLPFYVHFLPPQRDQVYFSFFIRVLLPILSLEFLLCVPKLAAEEGLAPVPST